MHRGVFGRKAGTVPGHQYSAALKKADIVWTAKTLDCWLQGPTKMVPGSVMGYSLPQAQDRADIISYFKALPAK